jgi:hypothetical protein
VLLKQPFVKPIFLGIVNKRYALSGGVLVGYGQYHTRYIHTIFLHTVCSVAERIFIGRLTYHFKGSFGVILDNQPVFCVHTRRSKRDDRKDNGKNGNKPILNQPAALNHFECCATLIKMIKSEEKIHFHFVSIAQLTSH